MRDSRRSAALDEATIRDVMWRFGKARDALDDNRFTTALDYIVESGELVKAMIERHGREFTAATSTEPLARFEGGASENAGPESSPPPGSGRGDETSSRTPPAAHPESATDSRKR